jgi:hypothetical protein
MNAATSPATAGDVGAVGPRGPDIGGIGELIWRFLPENV